MSAQGAWRAHKQRLVYGDQVLEDHKTFEDYGIQEFNRALLHSPECNHEGLLEAFNRQADRRQNDINQYSEGLESYMR